MESVEATTRSRKEGQRFDLGERTARFGESVIRFARALHKDIVSEVLIRQFVRAGTSVGANYCEADEGVSKKDFRNRIGICKKEAKETMYWLRMIAAALPSNKIEARPLWREAKEIQLILATIFRRCRA